MFAVRRALASSLAVGTLLAGLLAWPVQAAAASSCQGMGTDFNGDGYADVALGDPMANRESSAAQGQVTVMYGSAAGLGSGAVSSFRQGDRGVREVGEHLDHFGWSLAAADLNGDRCTDLVVGSPGEKLGVAGGAGIVQILWGSVDGLAAGKPATSLSAKSFGRPAGERAGLGSAVAAWSATAGRPGLVAIGVPGGAVGSHARAGWVGVYQVGGGKPRALDQDSTGVPGAAEAGDNFGAALAFGRFAGGSAGVDLAVGVPHEDVGSLVDAGVVTVLTDVASVGVSGVRGVGVDQNSRGVPGAAESGDAFGAALAAVTVSGTSRLAVGIPAEDLAGQRNAGAVQLFSSAGTALVVGPTLNQLGPAVAGEPVAGDSFGSRLAFGAPGVGDPETWLAVSSPSKDGSVDNNGMVQLFPLSDLGAERTYDPDTAGMPATPLPTLGFGLGLGFAGDGVERAFLVGAPYDTGLGRTGVVTVVPLGGGGLRNWSPGTGSVPVSDDVTFGWAVTTS